MEELVLQFAPFDGDFGAPEDVTLSNKMVTARKEGPCAHCGLTICKGERVRSMSSKFDGELMSHRWCALCCAAMAKCQADKQSDDEGNDQSDPWEDYEARAGIAQRSAQAAKQGAPNGQ